jgi:hypothetical protein
MQIKNYILITSLSLIFVACGGGGGSSSSSNVSSQSQSNGLNDNSNVAFNIPNVNNADNLPVNNIQSLK